MSLNKKLSAWVSAQLITSEQSDKIHAYETQKHNGLFWKTSLFIAGQLIGLGIIMLVAANWDIIPDSIKLLIDFALFGAFISGAYYTITHDHPHLSELFLILSFLMIAATIGLTAQIYNLDGGWKSFSLSWALLAVPFICFSRLTFFHICWLLLLLSGLNFMEELFRYIENNFYGAIIMTVIFALISSGCHKIHDLIKNKTDIISCKAFALLCGFLTYLIVFYISIRWGFDKYTDSTMLRRFMAHAFVFAFLGTYILLSVKNQDIKRFQRNTILAEIYIFILFCYHINQLWTEGISFIISGLMLLLLLYILKKTTRSIKQMEIFK